MKKKEKNGSHNQKPRKKRREQHILFSIYQLEMFGFEGGTVLNFLQRS